MITEKEAFMKIIEKSEFLPEIEGLIETAMNAGKTQAKWGYILPEPEADYLRSIGYGVWYNEWTDDWTIDFTGG